MKASATCGRTGDVPKGYEGAAGESRANAGIVPGLLRPPVMSQQVSFGHHRFEPATGRLWADQRELKLTRKAASVLGLLLERAGQPVTKQELFASVWSNTVVSDDALTTCIQELRKALGDDAKQPQYIETRHRYGYCFVAELTRTAPAAAAEPAPAVQNLPAIAVLPFMDMSPERDQDYFCEGIAEELIDALTHIDGLRVAARPEGHLPGRTATGDRHHPHPRPRFALVWLLLRRRFPAADGIKHPRAVWRDDGQPNRFQVEDIVDGDRARLSGCTGRGADEDDAGQEGAHGSPPER